jgi:hypothetical protein
MLREYSKTSEDLEKGHHATKVQTRLICYRKADRQDAAVHMCLKWIHSQIIPRVSLVELPQEGTRREEDKKKQGYGVASVYYGQDTEAAINQSTKPQRRSVLLRDLAWRNRRIYISCRTGRCSPWHIRIVPWDLGEQKYVGIETSHEHALGGHLKAMQTRGE